MNKASGMYLSELRLWNFRKYGVGSEENGDFDSSSPGLEIHFQKGVNVIIGENDSGKTAIIDAIRYILHTKSGEHIAFDEKDFYKPDEGPRTSRLKIECVFRGLNISDAATFLEWLSLEDSGRNKKVQILRLTLIATKDDAGYIRVRTFAGDGSESYTMPPEVRDYLSAVYLKPLRDASQDMTHGYKSRFSQILQAHPIFVASKKNENEKHELERVYEDLKKTIDTYFCESNREGKKITDAINEIIGKHFLLANDSKDAKIRLTGSELSDILRQLDLILEENKAGLGTLNLLSIAAELLLFEEQTRGLKLTLIEELEAHIHPQLQLRLIDYFEQESKFGQFILTTHSITLGATIPLEKLIVMKGNEAFSMDADSTMCSERDYKFLRRFLDATKANLFFAKGLLLVEGDAENLLIPTIAKIIGRDLHNYGVSIVNVGGTAYKRYVKIFQRKNGEQFGMPISIIADIDIKSWEYYREQKRKKKIYHITKEIRSELETSIQEVDWAGLPNRFSSKFKLDNFIKGLKIDDRNKTDKLYNIFGKGLKEITKDDIEFLREDKRKDLERLYDNEIKIFLPKCWTLEYDIARSGLYKQLARAIELAKAEMKDDDANDIIEEERKEINNKYKNGPNEETADKMFRLLYGGNVSKAITAQYLAQLLEDSKEEIKTILEKDEYLEYIVKAIKHVTAE